ncbi:hypothetical protein C3941_27630, partial [Kaistia algarum]
EIREHWTFVILFWTLIFMRFRHIFIIKRTKLNNTTIITTQIFKQCRTCFKSSQFTITNITN